MDQLILATQGIRYVVNSFSRRFKGRKRYSGNAKKICESIARDCWNGRYFLNSLGNYREFWMRDFGFSVRSLIKLGYKKEAIRTLDYALGKYAAAGHITTTITPSGRTVSFPNIYSPDSVALLFHSLAETKSKALVKKHKDFLEKEAENFVSVALDNNGLVKRNVQFSGMRDYAIRHSSCYDNTMVGLLAKSLNNLSLKNPLKNHPTRKILKDNFWTGTYFKDDIKNKHITSDANILPFWTGVISSKKMLKQVNASLQKEGLTEPFPLKYASINNKERMRLPEFFVPNWEKDSIWTNIGLLYVDTLSKLLPKEALPAKQKYVKIVERDGNLIEVFSDQGKPYQSWAYFADEGMLWSAILAANL